MKSDNNTLCASEKPQADGADYAIKVRAAQAINGLMDDKYIAEIVKNNPGVERVFVTSFLLGHEDSKNMLVELVNALIEKEGKYIDAGKIIDAIRSMPNVIGNGGK